MKLKEILQEKKENIINIASEHGAYNIRIIGSIARGDENEYTNFEFLVDCDSEKVTPWFPSQLIQDLQPILGRKVYIVTEKGLHSSICEKILAEAIPLEKI